MNELQSRLLNIFSFYHDICVENGLHYFASGGTMLGAARHHGFIPWDDDIDVWMPRPDYEKLKEIMKEKTGKYVLEAPGSNTGRHYYTIAKLYDTTTTAVEKTKFNVKKGIFLDIFPLDGLGNSEKEKRSIYRKMHFWNLFIASRVCVPRKERSSLKNMAIYISSIVPESVLNTEKLIERFDKACGEVSYDDSKYVGVLMGSYGERDIFPKEWFDEPILYDFETIKIYSVKNYDEVLTFVYGDWRKLPPKEKQTTSHDFEYLDLNKGYLDKTV